MVPIMSVNEAGEFEPRRMGSRFLEPIAPSQQSLAAPQLDEDIYGSDYWDLDYGAPETAPETYGEYAAKLPAAVGIPATTPDDSTNFGRRNLDSLGATWRQLTRPFTQELTPKDPVLDRIGALDYMLGAYTDKASPRYRTLAEERNRLSSSRKGTY